jgi:hypothetical protein
MSPFVTTSTCVSFTFYTPSIPSPYANLHIQANLVPSSPISIATTDFADALSKEGFPVLVNDPCNTVDLPFASTIPPDASHTAPTPTTSGTSISSVPLVATAKVSASAAMDDSIPDLIDAPFYLRPTAAVSASAAIASAASAAMDDSIPDLLDAQFHLRPTTAVSASAAIASTVDNNIPNSISNPAYGTTSPVSTASTSIPASANQRWYCITVGKQVGVFQGM